MAVTADEARNYLRLDYTEDDALISDLLKASERLCTDIARCDSIDSFYTLPNARAAVLYTLGYLFEHREEADHHSLVMTLRFLLFASREGAF